MSRPDHYRRPAPMTELDAGLTPYQRRTNDEHAIRCLTIGPDGRDDIDELVEELRAFHFEEKGARP